jgi:hypothetical protein
MPSYFVDEEAQCAADMQRAIALSLGVGVGHDGGVEMRNTN